MPRLIGDRVADAAQLKATSPILNAARTDASRWSTAKLPPPGNHFPGGSTGLPSTGFGTSPMTVFSGQTENKGHFAHPTASAMGQSVMTAPLAVKKDRAYADVARLAGSSASRSEGDRTIGDNRRAT